MATLTIRNVPEELHAVLKERARMNRRSVNQEVIAELLAALPETAEERQASAQRRWAEVNHRVDAIRARMKRFATAEEIDAAIREGKR